eukprot:scaffold318907_cov30-Tisochrysis_lutea.AAC.1
MDDDDAEDVLVDLAKLVDEMTRDVMLDQTPAAESPWTKVTRRPLRPAHLSRTAHPLWPRASRQPPRPLWAPPSLPPQPPPTAPPSVQW